MKNLDFLKNINIAHRGIYDNERIFENTLPAFKRAIKYRYTIQLDVRLLDCGTIIVFHDKNLERLLHVDQKTNRTTYDELCYISKFQIPTLDEVLELVNGEVPLLIEFKTETRKYLLEKKLVEKLDNYNGEFAIQSFNKRTVKWFNKNRPNYIIGYAVGKNNKKQELFFKKYDFLMVNAFIFKDKEVRKLQERSLVLGYTIQTKEDYQEKKEVYDNLVLDNILEIIEL